ncbi:hypothetical protein PMAYCL1PPCAC_30816 [Pristionchus mayeri]|uniref:CUB domain-containing protein n=1 Tax=Pristionchus mayeri TaxID=1317129 RepID=A0AAN5DBV8_9BILA|nr:hypothetical protein PMAYCL1PPCAC_30816 [Pristionchus mayeri]
MSGLRAEPSLSPHIVVLFLLLLANYGSSLNLPCSPSAVYHQMKSNEAIEIKTPGFDNPGHYPANMTCEYIFQGSNTSSKIQVDFVFADFEQPIFSGCADYIVIKDGSSTTSKELIKMCGSDPLKSIVSTNDMIHISIVSDRTVQRRGAHIVIREFFEGSCGADWQTRTAFPVCFKFNGARKTWLDAQRECFAEMSNLMTTTNQEEYDFIVDTYGDNSSLNYPWFGIFDAATEGTYQSIIFKEALWPHPQPIVANNSPIRDCVMLDFDIKEGLTHVAEDCLARHPFICKKYKDGSTSAVMGPRQMFRRSQIAEKVDLTIWILIIIATILLIVLLCLFCKDCIKRKCCPNRVEPENRLMRGLEQDYRNPVPTAPPRNTSTNRARFVDDVEARAKETTIEGAQRAKNNHETTNNNIVRPTEVNVGTLSLPTTTSPLPSVANPLPPLLDRSPPATQTVHVMPVDAVVHRSEIPIVHHVEDEMEEEVLQPRPPSSPREMPLNVPSLQLRTDHQRGETIDEPGPSNGNGFKTEGGFRSGPTIKESTFISTREESFMRTKKNEGLFEKPKTKVLDNVSAISLDEFWNATKK